MRSAMWGLVIFLAIVVAGFRACVVIMERGPRPDSYLDHAPRTYLHPEGDAAEATRRRRAMQEAGPPGKK